MGLRSHLRLNGALAPDVYRFAQLFRAQSGKLETLHAGNACCEEGRKMVIILIIVLLLVFGGGGGYYGYNRWGSRGGAGIGLGTVLLILLVCYLLGLL